MSAFVRGVSYVVVVIVVLGGLSILSPNLNRGPKGLFLPTVQRTYAPSTTPAKLLESMPAKAEVIGRVSVEQYSPRPNSKVKQQALIYAAQLAQKAGGNGLLIANLQYLSPAVEGVAGMAKYLLTGWVVRS